MKDCIAIRRRFPMMLNCLVSLMMHVGHRSMHIHVPKWWQKRTNLRCSRNRPNRYANNPLIAPACIYGFWWEIRITLCIISSTIPIHYKISSLRAPLFICISIGPLVFMVEWKQLRPKHERKDHCLLPLTAFNLQYIDNWPVLKERAFTLIICIYSPIFTLSRSAFFTLKAIKSPYH